MQRGRRDDGVVVGRLEQRKPGAAQGHAPDHVDRGRVGRQSGQQQQAAGKNRHADGSQQAIGVAANQAAGQGRRQHNGHGPGRDQQPRLQGAAAQPIQQQERQGQIGQGLGAKRPHGSPHRQGKHGYAQQIYRKQGRGQVPLATQIHTAHSHPGRQHAPRLGRGHAPPGTAAGNQPLAAHKNQREHQHVQRHIQGSGARWRHRAGWIEGQSTPAQPQREGPQRQVERKQPLPWRQRQNTRRHRGAGHRRQRNHHGIDGQAAAQLRTRIGQAHQRGIDAHDAGGTQPLHRPRKNQRAQRIGQHGPHRRHREQRHAHQIDTAVPQALAQRCQRQQHDERGDLVCVDHPDGLGGAGIELARNARQGQVDDAAIEHRHRDAQNDDQHGPVARRLGQPIGWPGGGLGSGMGGGVCAVHQVRLRCTAPIPVPGRAP